MGSLCYRVDCVCVTSIPLRRSACEDWVYDLESGEEILDGGRVMKTCSACKQEKKEEMFSRDKHRKDGRDPQCKECRADWHAMKRGMKPVKLVKNTRTEDLTYSMQKELTTLEKLHCRVYLECDGVVTRWMTNKSQPVNEWMLELSLIHI